MQSTSVRIDEKTHIELKDLASSLNLGVGETVSLAVKILRQLEMGRDLVEPLSDVDRVWLDVDLR